jgi:hypothetical protein
MKHGFETIRQQRARGGSGPELATKAECRLEAGEGCAAESVPGSKQPPEAEHTDEGGSGPEFATKPEG